jgi:cold shock CspA family protein
MSEKRIFGIVKAWVDKGFGFVIPEGDLPETFVHCRDILDGKRDLERGDRVTFEMGEDRQGRPCAVRVKLIETTMVDLHGTPTTPGKPAWTFTNE